MNDTSSNDQMLEVFLFEMSSLLEQLDDILLTSEKNQSLKSEDVSEIFRIMHTFKGSSAMMDFIVISSITHKLEDCFFLVREHGIKEEHFATLFDVMLDATDFLKSQLDTIQNGDELSTGNDVLLDRATNLYNLLNDSPAAENPSPAAPIASAPVAASSENLLGLGQAYLVNVIFEEDCGMENLRAFMLIENLGKECHIASSFPANVENAPETAAVIRESGFSLVVESEMDTNVLQTFIEEDVNVKSVSVAIFSDSIDIDTDKISEVNISGDVYNIKVTFESDCGMENLRSFMLLNSLRSKCKIVSFLPTDIETNPDSAKIITEKGFHFVLETPLPENELKDIIENSMYVDSSRVIPAKSVISSAGKTAPAAVASASSEKNEAEKTEQTPASASSTHNKPVKQNLINVSLYKLDELMDLMGELVITESMVTRSPDLANMVNLGSLENFSKATRQLSKLTDEIQKMVMSIRLVPIAATFQKMQRIVRDMSRNLGKDAELVTMGEETDIDKTIIDGIGDPIMHLVRNSMDHGVESPEERIAAGKNPKATVTLSAQNTGGEILITVSDDGKGLDAEKLIAKAQSNGILTKPASEHTEKEAFQLLMLPGFSTKEQVTEYSGRGVGMDVVKQNIEKIGGTVLVESKKGHGMSVFLKIPLTLAIVDGMNICVGDGVYTLQITAVSESFKAKKEQIVLDSENNEMIMIRGNVYPVIRLYDIYNIPNAITDIEEGILILVQSAEQAACLFVDKLVGMQQIVVKSLPAYLKNYNVKNHGISGCTILGDGNISLILDVGTIIGNVVNKN